MKKTIAMLLCFVFAANLCVLCFNCSFITKAYADNSVDGNSIIVKVEAPTEVDFDTQDFPEVNCSSISILEKRSDDGIYYYTLLLNTPEYYDVKEGLSALLENPLVTSASVNHYKNGYNKDIYMKLPVETVYVSLGGQTELSIDYYNSTVYVSFWEGIAFSVDPNVIDEDSFTKDMFSEQGILGFWPHIDNRGEFILINKDPELEASKCESHLYYGYVDTATRDSYDYAYIEAADAMARLEGINSVYLLEEKIVGPSRPIDDYYFEEIWQCDNADIACVLTCVNNISFSAGNTYNKTAIISGLALGETTLTVIRKGDKGWIKQECTVRVFEPSDVNGDGVCNNLDAIALLKHDAGLDELSEESLENSDMNEDGKVDNLDAAMLLKYDAGLI